MEFTHFGGGLHESGSTPDWPTFKYGPDHAGVNPYENVLSPSTVGGLQVGWTFGGPEFFDGSPAVSGGRVFAGAEGTIYALDASTGAPLWKRSTPIADHVSSPAVRGHVVYYAANTGVLHASDVATGTDQWTYSIASSLSDLTLAGGVLYFGGRSNGYVYAVDARTGTERWKTYVGGIGVYAAPVVARGVVYAANDSVTYSLSVLDASSGTVLWTAPTGGYADSSPAVSGGLVYLGSGDGKLYAFPAAGCGQSTCSPVWTATTGSEVQSSPSVADGMVFVGSADHNVYAFDALTGALEWTVATGDPITIQSAAVANGVVFIGSNDHVLRAIDALTGQVLWTYTTGDLIGGSSVVANGWVFAGSFDKNFYAFHLPG